MVAAESTIKRCPKLSTSEIWLPNATHHQLLRFKDKKTNITACPSTNACKEYIRRLQATAHARSSEATNITSDKKRKCTFEGIYLWYYVIFASRMLRIECFVCSVKQWIHSKQIGCTKHTTVRHQNAVSPFFHAVPNNIRVWGHNYPRHDFIYRKQNGQATVLR